MRENPLDNILDKVEKRHQGASNAVAQWFKGSRPFATEKLSSDAKLWAIDNLGTEDMKDLINEFGQERVGYMLYEINKLRMRRI